MKRAIVLSGGGARGSYQIGVWKALRKLHIKYDIVTGTSVGALNGVLMAQNTFFRGIWFWHNLSFKLVFKEEMCYDCNTSHGKKAIYKKYVNATLKNRGMDVTNLESTIDKVLNENKARKSHIKFGLVTCKMPGFKPLQLTIDDIPVGKLKDYLVASATLFPAFKKKNIDNCNYVDGGYYDNLPFNLAIEMGATEIIAVDIGIFGLKRPFNHRNVKITYITPRNNLGSVLLFNKDFARRGIRLGYNDTMKTFGYLDGNKYTFKRGHLNKNFMKYANTYKLVLANTLEKENRKIVSNLLKLTNYEQKLQAKDLTMIIEKLGKIFKIEDSYIYDINRFNNLLHDKLSKVTKVDKTIFEKQLKERDIIRIMDRKNIVKYVYECLESNERKMPRHLLTIALVLPNIFLGAIYLYVVKNAQK